MLQQTLIIIKPDGVEKGLTDEIIRRYEAAGLSVVKRKDWKQAPMDIIEKHYPMDDEYIRSLGEKSVQAGDDTVMDTLSQGKKILGWLRNFITSGPIVCMILQGEEAVSLTRKITGYTDPATAQKGTIRGDLGEDSILKANRQGRPVYNLIHASGTPEEAKREISLWFGKPFA